jgi:cytochrome oxidase Cu insertion factor (SCO1/SenC/PrrC family)
MRLVLGSLLALAGLFAACGRGSGGSGADANPAMAKYNEGLVERGDTLPDISAVTLDGQPVTNASLRGKTVLLNLWFFH